MINRYYSILILLLIVNIHIFSENILIDTDAKDILYVDFNGYEPTRYEIFNLYNSRIMYNENTIYEKLIGSAYYTGTHNENGALLNLISGSNLSFPENFYIVSTGQFINNKNLIVENFKDTVEKQKIEKKKVSDWSFDASISGGRVSSFLDDKKLVYTVYGINAGILYDDAFRLKISPRVFENDNILLNTSIEMSTQLNFNNSCGFLSFGFFPYQKLDNENNYLFSFGLGYHLILFESKFFLELATEADVVNSENDEMYDFHMGIAGSVGYSF